MAEDSRVTAPANQKGAERREALDDLLRSPELPANSFFDSPREAATIRALARHREVAPRMYRGVGVTVTEERAIVAVIAPLLSEIERFQGYCREWAAKCAALEEGA